MIGSDISTKIKHRILHLWGKLLFMDLKKNANDCWQKSQIALYEKPGIKMSKNVLTQKLRLEENYYSMIYFLLSKTASNMSNIKRLGYCPTYFYSPTFH